MLSRTTFNEYLVLRGLLDNREASAQELVAVIETAVGKKPSPATVYAILHAAEYEGLVAGTWQEQIPEGDAKRKRGARRVRKYLLTQKGKKTFSNLEKIAVRMNSPMVTLQRSLGNQAPARA